MQIDFIWWFLFKHLKRGTIEQWKYIHVQIVKDNTSISYGNNITYQFQLDSWILAIQFYGMYTEVWVMKNDVEIGWINQFLFASFKIICKHIHICNAQRCNAYLHMCLTTWFGFLSQWLLKILHVSKVCYVGLKKVSKWAKQNIVNK